MILVLFVVLILCLFKIWDLYDVTAFLTLSCENLSSYDISVLIIKQWKQFRLLKRVISVGGHKFLTNYSAPCSVILMFIVCIIFFFSRPSNSKLLNDGIVNVIIFDVELVLLLQEMVVLSLSV